MSKHHLLNLKRRKKVLYEYKKIRQKRKVY